MTACAYCKTARATTTDHFIKKKHRHTPAFLARENDRYKAPACNPCNVSIYVRNFVPEGYEDRIPELERLTHQKYAVYRGPESLREVIK